MASVSVSRRSIQPLSLSGGLLLLLMITLLALLFSLFWGRYELPWQEGVALLWQWITNAPLTNEQETQLTVMLDIRLPRLIAAIAIGAALAVSGAAFQGLFMNPLVSPGVLGVLSGAAFGAALGMLFGVEWLVIQIASFVGALAALLLALWLGRDKEEPGMVRLVLAGMIVGSLFTALLSVIKYMADPYDKLPAIVYWLMGSLSMIDGATIAVLAPLMLVGVLLLIAYGRVLNVMSMGEDEAKTLGIPVKQTRLIILVLAALLGAVTVTLAGMIGWVGLVIPHLVRLVIGADNRWLLPYSAVAGGLYLLLIDNVSRLLLTSEIPLGILTALIGLPVFAWLLHRGRRVWS